MADRPFPGHAVRDALALTRLLYADAIAGLDVERPTALMDIGKILADALTLGRLDPRSLGHKAATRRASEAMAQLVALGWTGEVAALIRIAQARVDGPPGPYVSERDKIKEMQRR